MIEIPVSFPCEDFTIEGIRHFPDGEGPFPLVIVCHPHPLMGGDMFNPIVYSICRELVNRSISALRFNFRGVGNSGGTYGDGIAEREDVKAAIEFGLADSRIDRRKLGLAGYSFGDGVITPVAVDDERVSLLALVSPVMVEGWKKLKTYRKPKLFISGEDDYYIPPQDLLAKISELPEPKKYKIISGADHSWRGHTSEAAAAAADFFSEGFKAVT